MRRAILTAALSACAVLAGCATGPYAGPVSVTRFVAQDAPQLGAGTVFVEALPAPGEGAVDLAPYGAAVAAELARLGYRESTRADAGQVAEVRIEQYRKDAEERRGPVSVGVGGSTGGYGSGLGVGIGFNLGGGPRPRLGTKLSVRLRDAASGATLWEGRAEREVSDNSPLAASDAGAAALAAALFRDFPGNNGETVTVPATGQ